MFIAEGRMRGNLGTFVNDGPLAEDSVEATMELRNSHTVRMTESTKVQVARKATAEEEDEIFTVLDGSNPQAPHYRVQKLEGRGLYFIEGLYQI